MSNLRYLFLFFIYSNNVGNFQVNNLNNFKKGLLLKNNEHNELNFKMLKGVIAKNRKNKNKMNMMYTFLNTNIM